MTISPEAVEAARDEFRRFGHAGPNPIVMEAALAAAEPFIRAAVIEECARIVFDQYGEAPRSEYDNGGTQDGWQMACYKIDELIRALAKEPLSHAAQLAKEMQEGMARFVSERDRFVSAPPSDEPPEPGVYPNDERPPRPRALAKEP